MTGSQHYLAAEQLLEHAATMLDADVDAERVAALAQQQLAVPTLGQAHAQLAAAAAAGLPGTISSLDERERREAAAVRPDRE